MARRRDEPVEDGRRGDPRLAADIAMGVAGLVLIPLLMYLGAGIFVSTPPPEAPGIHVGGFAETKDIQLSLEAAQAYIERAEFLFRENYLDIFLDRFTRASADLSDRERMLRADLEWQWASAVLDHVAAIHTKIERSIEKGEDPRLATLKPIVEDRLLRIAEERKKLDAQRIFIR